ncbi:MAG: 16S rRNA (guanine(527)-N(7))-methyltransferase RsmG [Clostridia bacterium]|nr:16S rRNA (guanine(527)-N(7))-methyltransferase RsmG [Clostridia bacterium]
MFIPLEKLKEYALNFGVLLDDTALERFDTYGRLLAEWNEKINLTAITDPEGIALKHFADSLSVLKYCEIGEGASLIDVGTGAGFPGLALLIARPDIKLTLLDSTKKKLTVIEDILSNIGLSAELLHSRAEEAGQKEEYREKFDFATARAVANLRELSEYCLPFVKKSGSFISMKAAKADEEISGAKKAIAVLGGKIEKAESFVLGEAGERNIIMIKKVSSTPGKYPRPSAKIAKNPLE